MVRKMWKTHGFQNQYLKLQAASIASFLNSSFYGRVCVYILVCEAEQESSYCSIIAPAWIFSYIYTL